MIERKRVDFDDEWIYHPLRSEDPPRQDYLGGHLVYVCADNTARSQEGFYIVNLEMVRQGWSRYWNKYGRSPNLDSEFRKAEAEAKTAKRGIWAEEWRRRGLSFGG